MGDLEGKVVLITGASRGIGKALTLAFAREGAKIVANYKSDTCAANSVASLVRESGAECLSVQADISQEDDRQRLLRATLDTYARVDIVVNNAGMRYGGSLSELTQSSLRDITDVNLLGPFLLSRDAAEIMKTQSGGHVINISSVSGMVPRKDGGMVYGMTKAGLIYLTKSLARHYAPEVRVNAIAPGYTKTDLFMQGHGAELDKIVSKIPLKKINSPDDIAQGAVYLCKTGNITGQILVIDGGSSL